MRHLTEEEMKEVNRDVERAKKLSEQYPELDIDQLFDVVEGKRTLKEVLKESAGDEKMGNNDNLTLNKTRELLHRIYDLEELIQEGIKQEYIDELADVINEFIPLVNNLNWVNGARWSMCNIIYTVHQYRNLEEAVYKLKNKQLELMGLK